MIGKQQLVNRNSLTKRFFACSHPRLLGLRFFLWLLLLLLRLLFLWRSLCLRVSLRLISRMGRLSFRMGLLRLFRRRGVRVVLRWMGRRPILWSCRCWMLVGRHGLCVVSRRSRLYRLSRLRRMSFGSCRRRVLIRRRGPCVVCRRSRLCGSRLSRMRLRSCCRRTCVGRSSGLQVRNDRLGGRLDGSWRLRLRQRHRPEDRPVGGGCSRRRPMRGHERRARSGPRNVGTRLKQRLRRRRSRRFGKNNRRTH